MEKRFGFRLDESDVLEGPLVDWLNSLSRFRRGEWIRRQLLAAYYNNTRPRPARETPRRQRRQAPRAPIQPESGTSPRSALGARAPAETGSETGSEAGSEAGSELRSEPASGTTEATTAPERMPSGLSGDKPFGHLKGIIQPR